MSINSAKNKNSARESRESRDDRLREIILTTSKIPEAVAVSDFTRVDERTFDEALFRILTDRHPSASISATSPRIVERRADALYPYIGRTLVCILISLPGVRYTVEIDPLEKRVVHWEWHPV